MYCRAITYSIGLLNSGAPHCSEELMLNWKKALHVASEKHKTLVKVNHLSPFD